MAAAAEAAALAAEQQLAVNDPEAADIRIMLGWCGFSTAVHRAKVADELFRSYSDIKATNESDITELVSSMRGRPAADRITMGMRKIKKLRAIIHWVKDFRRISEPPSIDGLDRDSFNDALDIAARRHEIRKQQMDDDGTLKEASPGPLSSELKWQEWEEAFQNYLSCIYGVDGVPLVYVIRENDSPDRNTVFSDFTDKTIACAELSGPAFDADKRKVHQIIVSFTQGQLSEDWIKPVAKEKNGRSDMKALRHHFSGEGNSSRRIALAERLKETLHYRNEKAMSFETFLSKCQKMFNIFKNQGEEMNEEAKIRFLLKQVKCDQLKEAVAALKTRITTDPSNSVTYSTVANHLAACVAELPDFISKARSVGATSTNGNDAPSEGITRSDGSIHIGHYPNWRQLSKSDRDKVIEERKRLKGAKGKGKNGKSDNQASTELEKLKKALAKKKRAIAALKKKASKSDDDKSDDDDAGKGEDAGDQFGGKRKKKKNN